MKILLFGVGGLLLVIAGLVIVGSLLPKRHIVSRSARFHATPERLYALVAGPQNWRPEVVRCESISNAEGRELVQETTRNGETVTYELLDKDPPVSLKRRIATENLPYSGTWDISIRPESGMTIVGITESGEVSNPVFRFVSRLILGHTRTMDAYLKNLGKETGEEVTVERPGP